MYESIIINESSYDYIINDISYQCCAYSYTFIRNFKLVHACSNFLGTYIRYSEIKNASVNFYARVFVRFSSIFSRYTIVLRSYKRMKWYVFIF